MDKAIKHSKIAAGFGHTGSLNIIKDLFPNRGHATRDDCQQALLSFRQYVEEVRNDQRDKAAAFKNDYKYLF
jgi:hypothetical protein